MKWIIILQLLSLVACNNSGNTKFHFDKDLDSNKQLNLNKVTKTKVVDTSFERKELIFMKWLVDTLNVLNPSVKNFNLKTSGIKKEVIVNPDSLVLSINYIYDFPLNFKVSTPDVQSLLKLLKEYDEYPKGQFALKFKTEYIYNPSPVPELLYDMYDDIADVQIIEENGKKISNYDIIRGRINYKRVTTLLTNGDKKEEKIDFFWEGKKLIKEKSN
jgi:hypothetical protein